MSGGDGAAAGGARDLALLAPLVATGEVSDVGAPAAFLRRAAGAGQAIVPTWVVPAPVFRRVASAELPGGHDLPSLLRGAGRGEGEERIARARERVLECELPGELCADLQRLARRPPAGTARLRVAPSATPLDPIAWSAAGLATSREIALDAQTLEAAVRAAWASALDDETLSALRAARVRDFGLAVLVQALPDAAGRGTLVTREGDRATRLAQLQLGEERSASLALRFPPGVAKLVRVPATGGAEGPAGRVPTRRLARSLDGVATALSPLETSPLAVRFIATRRGEVQIFDVRPELPTAAVRSTAHVWTCAGLDGAVPRVPTLSSWSAGSRAVAAAITRELDVLGGERARPEQVLGRFAGRAYYDLGTVLPALARVRGLDLGALLDDVDRDIVGALARSHQVSPAARRLPELTVAALALSAHERRVRSAVERFEREASAERRWIAELDLAILPDDALSTTLRDARALLEEATTLVVEATLGVALAHVVVSALVARAAPGDVPPQPLALTVALAEAETARAGAALVDSVDRGRGDRRGLDTLAAGARTLADLPHGALRLGLEEWLAAHGDRGLDELELSRPRFREDPGPILAIARHLARGHAAPPAAARSRIRVSSDRALADLEARAGWLERPLLARAIPALRGMISLREGQRVALARTVALLRVVLLDVDRRLRRLDPGLPPGAAFHCALDELAGALRSARADLGAAVRMRAATHARWLATPDPPATFVERPPTVAIAGEGRLHGAGTGSGVVEGRVVVLGEGLAALERLGAESIVVTPSLDLGALALTLGVRGVVTERGGALAHAAVVLRQWGVPAVLGVAGATAALREGSRVRVDAARGAVELA